MDFSPLNEKWHANEKGTKKRKYRLNENENFHEIEENSLTVMNTF